MATQMVCNRCGKIINGEINCGFRAHGSPKFGSKINGEIDVDLCHECTDALIYELSKYFKIQIVNSVSDASEDELDRAYKAMESISLHE